jgi:hypothetical protein
MPSRLQFKVLNVRKRDLGEEHPSTLRSMSNLATTYSNLDQWDEAESLQVQSAEARPWRRAPGHTNKHE